MLLLKRHLLQDIVNDVLLLHITKWDYHLGTHVFSK